MAVETYKLPGIGPGMPDYTTSQPGTQKVGTISTLADMGELAARLGSPVTFDRRGNVIWHSSFQENLAGEWTIALLGTGAAATLSTLKTLRGNTSCKLTTGDDISDYALIRKYLAYPQLGKIGSEFSFTVNTGVIVHIYLILFTGALCYEAHVRYTPSTGKLELQYGSTTYVTIATVSLSNLQFHFVKLVVDFLAGKNVRLLLDSTEYDIAAYPIYHFADATAAYLHTDIFAEAAAAANASIYVGHNIVTENEPENPP